MERLQRAVVLGGSIAGLSAARVLSDHADEVVIVEPDDVEGPAGGRRRGVPQSGQVHALLDRGRIELARWFPDIETDLVDRGAVPSSGAEIHHYVDGLLKVPAPGEQTIGMTRALLEEVVRRKTMARGNVTLVRGRARGLIYSDGAVHGAQFVPDGARDTESLTADLVVDATGRSSRLGDWLQQGGWPAPTIQRMQIDLGYATAFFRTSGELPDVRVVQSIATPADGRDSGAAVRVEGDRWMVVLSNYAGRRPGRDPEAFLERCRSAPGQPFAVIADSCPLDSEVETYHMPDSRRRAFTGLKRFPAGILPLGDAVASFNPLYGQGMTCATLHASCLDTYLRSEWSPKAPALSYLRAVEKIAAAAWQLSTLMDLGQPHVTGPYPKGYRFARWYSGQVVRASITDPEVHRRFLAVAHMRAHPRTLRSLTTALQVARVLAPGSKAA